MGLTRSDLCVREESGRGTGIGAMRRRGGETG